MAGKRSYKHYISLCSVIAESGLLPESTIANKITTHDWGDIFLSMNWLSALTMCIQMDWTDPALFEDLC
ncbi:TPA: hypothetical protein ACKFMB_000026 [Citrobacter amalonaticus]